MGIPERNNEKKKASTANGLPKEGIVKKQLNNNELGN